MQLAVEFPSVSYREGNAAVRRLAVAIEEIGFDQLEVFDHVVMGYETPDRDVRYPAQMPILEALMTLSHVAAVTNKIGLGTKVSSSVTEPSSQVHHVNVVVSPWLTVENSSVVPVGSHW